MDQNYIFRCQEVLAKLGIFGEWVVLDVSTLDSWEKEQLWIFWMLKANEKGCLVDLQLNVKRCQWSRHVCPALHLWVRLSSSRFWSKDNIEKFQTSYEVTDFRRDRERLLIERETIFIGPRYTWGPIYGSECLKCTLFRLNWCDSGWWRYQLNSSWWYQ